MPRIKSILIDYESKTVQIDYKRDSLISDVPFYSKPLLYPTVEAPKDFLDFAEKQKATDKWYWIDPDAEPVKQNVSFTIDFHGFFQFTHKTKGFDTMSVTYPFDATSQVTIADASLPEQIARTKKD